MNRKISIFNLLILTIGLCGGFITGFYLKDILQKNDPFDFTTAYVSNNKLMYSKMTCFPLRHDGNCSNQLIQVYNNLNISITNECNQYWKNYLKNGSSYNYSNPTALCNDGTYSYSSNRRGTCSSHGGVSFWY